MEVCRIQFRISKPKEGGNRVLFETTDPTGQYYPVLEAPPRIVQSILNDAKVPATVIQSIRDQGLVLHLAFDLGKETVLSLAARTRIRLVGLRSNVDAFAEIIVDGVKEEIFVGRFNPIDRFHFLARRSVSRERIRATLDETLEFASTSDFKFDAVRGREALGHRVARDRNGLAPDFNPNPESLRDDLRRQLFDEDPSWMLEASEDAIQERITRESDGLIETMQSYLLGGSPDTGTVNIVLSNSRSLDEIAAVRQLSAKLRRENPAIDIDFQALERINPDMNDTEVLRILTSLKKDRGITLHHSGKVGLNAGGFHTCEIQFVRREAHSKVALIATGGVIDDVGEFVVRESMGFAFAFENLLGHVGGCYVYRLANGTRYMR